MSEKPMKKKLKRARLKWIVFAIFIVLTPLGLLAPGGAYGEWSSSDLQQMLGYVPAGIAKGEELWKALFKDYTMPFLSDDFLSQSIGYILSAIIGVALIYVLALVIGKFLAAKEEKTIAVRDENVVK